MNQASAEAQMTPLALERKLQSAQKSAEHGGGSSTSLGKRFSDNWSHAVNKYATKQAIDAREIVEEVDETSDELVCSSVSYSDSDMDTKNGDVKTSERHLIKRKSRKTSQNSGKPQKISIDSANDPPLPQSKPHFLRGNSHEVPGMKVFGKVEPESVMRDSIKPAAQRKHFKLRSS